MAARCCVWCCVFVSCVSCGVVVVRVVVVEIAAGKLDLSLGACLPCFLGRCLGTGRLRRDTARCVASRPPWDRGRVRFDLANR